MSLDKEQPLCTFVLKTAGFLLVCPAAAWADNCGSFSDCFGAVASAAAAIASIATGTALLSAIAGLFGGGGDIDNAIPGADTSMGLTQGMMNWSSGIWE